MCHVTVWRSRLSVIFRQLGCRDALTNALVSVGRVDASLRRKEEVGKRGLRLLNSSSSVRVKEELIISQIGPPLFINGHTRSRLLLQSSVSVNRRRTHTPVVGGGARCSSEAPLAFRGKGV